MHTNGELEVRIYPVEDGYVAEGPGFYAWDEEQNEILRAVREFVGGGGTITPTNRMLRIPLKSDPRAAS